MKIEINSQIFSDFKKEFGQIFGVTDSEIIENLMLRKLYKTGIDGYEIDNLTKLLTFPRLKRDLISIVNKNFNDKNPVFYKSLLYFNISNMKYYNDYNGLHVGDTLISNFANELIKQYKNEKIYRYGGQEFLITSFEDLKLKEHISLNGVDLKQYKITINISDFYKLHQKGYMDAIWNKISEINTLKKEITYNIYL